MIKTAIVILNWNGLDLLKSYLPVFKANSGGDDSAIWVADNGSTDGSVAWVRTNHPETGIIELESNQGFAEGYNRALDKIDARYYIIVNSDIRVTPGWLSPMISYLDNNPGTAACQPKILSEQDHTSFEYAGAAGGYIDKYGYPFCRGRIQNHLEKDTGQYNDQRVIFWSSGACMAIRSEVWREAGGFDGDFFAHMEEIDLCWRIHSAGHTIMSVPESVVYHVGGGTLNYGTPRKVYLNFRNNLYLLHKNLPERILRKRIFTRMVLDGVAAVMFLFTFHFRNFREVLRAHHDYLRDRPRLDEKRRKINSEEERYKKMPILNKSIIAGFYIGGKKVFTDYYVKDPDKRL
ncbi:MAG: glycosyltransferase family 2 protein [Bacteroidales bacterium]